MFHNFRLDVVFAFDGRRLEGVSLSPRLTNFQKHVTCLFLFSLRLFLFSCPLKTRFANIRVNNR